MSVARSSAASASTSLPGPTEFDILKAKHKFLRDDDPDETQLSWEDKLAKKYYSSLYREYCVCDLKHYKSGNFALRWRTEDEVVAGAGESTCGNTRCALHSPRNVDPADAPPALTTLELPFAYVEDGAAKSALVKVVLCPKCRRKLMWKRNKEKARREQAAGGAGRSAERLEAVAVSDPGKKHGKRRESSRERRADRSRSRSPRRKADRSRSRSPRRKDDSQKRRRSPPL